MLTLILSFVFYISLNLTFTYNTKFCKNAETTDQTINVFHYNSTASCCLSTSRLCFQSLILSAMNTALQIITQIEIIPISCMQFLTHSFAFQIEEEGYGSTFEGEKTVGERKKRIKEVSTTHVPRCSLQLLKECIRVLYSASGHSNPICLFFHVSLTSLIITCGQ